MSRHRNAQAQMVSVALYSAIIVLGISTVVIVGQPILEDMRDAEAFEAAKDMLTDMETTIRAVAEADEGSRTEIGLRFARGTFMFDKADDSITYELETNADIISPGSSRQIGDLRVSAMAGVTVEKDTVDNQPCWRIENNHVSVCIRDIPRNTSEQIGSDTVGYWRFNRNQGRTAYDNASYGNDGTISGARWTDGLQGSALAFDGENDHVNVSDDAVLDVTKNMTVSLWLYRDGTNDADDWEGLVSKGDGSGSVYALYRHSGANELGIRLNGGSDYRFSWNPNVGRWYHVVWVQNSTSSQLFVDGGDTHRETIDSEALTGMSDDPLFIGRNAWDGNDRWNGTIDEVRIWNRSLDADEVEWLYKQHGMLDFIDTKDLILEYRNRDVDKALNADFKVSLQTNQDVAFTNNGTGYVEPALTGSNLGRGQIRTDVESFFGIDYNIVFTLRSGSDFLQVDVTD